MCLFFNAFIRSFVLLLGRYIAVLIRNIVLWRRNPQCSAACCITMFLSLNELSSGVNSVAGGMRKTALRTNLGIGGVDMPSMRAAVNDNVGFEIEENDDRDTKDKKDGGSCKKAASSMKKEESVNEENTIQQGRRFSSRFPSRRTRVLDS